MDLLPEADRLDLLPEVDRLDRLAGVDLLGLIPLVSNAVEDLLGSGLATHASDSQVDNLRIPSHL